MVQLQQVYAQNNIATVRVSLQKRLPSEIEQGAFYIANEIQAWKPCETAIIICNMWDRHWCIEEERRVTEMAPSMNNVISIAREKDILIVHAPSQCMAFYKNDPARKLGQKYKSKKAQRLISGAKLDSENNAVCPLGQSDGNCSDSPGYKLGTPCPPCTRQIDLINISDKDAISASGVEIGGLFYHNGIKNVILIGVRTDIGVLQSSFGLRNMVRLGMNVVLMRDLTDTMCDSKESPGVNHFTRNSLMNEYIETYVCPTIVSTDFTGQKQFRFKDDTRPVVAFLTAESEYNSNLSLPAFARELLLTEEISCEFGIGLPTAQGDDRHNIENLQILEDTDLAVIFVRRRGLEPEKMDKIRNYIKKGKPVLGIRTASHAFDPRIKAENNSPFISRLAKWPEFDKEILGGNYKNHFGNKLVAEISVVPGMESHPILRNVSLKDFHNTFGLYRNQNLQSEKAQVLLIGTVAGQPSQPILWSNNTGRNYVVYTSLGSMHDWQNKNFRQIMKNSVCYLLNTSSFLTGKGECN